MTIGRMQDLNLKAGDKVECVTAPYGAWTVGNRYKMTRDGLECDTDDPQQRTSVATFRIISRASDTPKTWGEMTDDEKGALLLADHRGEVIEHSHNQGATWKEVTNGLWHERHAYRVRPEPVRETVVANLRAKDGTFIGTVQVETADHKPDWSTLCPRNEQ